MSDIILLESLDDSYEITRSESKYPFIYDQWDFDVNGVTHIVRFSKADPKKIGPRATIITFGVRKGLQIRRKITGVGNIRKYLATVLKAIENSVEDPTDKLKMRLDGLILAIPTEIYDKVGERFQRIARIKLLKKKFRVSPVVADNIDTGMDDTSCIFVLKSGKNFKSAFPKMDISIENDYDEADSVINDVVYEIPSEKQQHEPETRFEKTAPEIEENIFSKYSHDELREYNFEWCILEKFFVSISGKIDSSTSLNVSSIKNLDEMTISTISSNKFDVSEIDLVLALNYMGIRTKNYRDLYLDYSDKSYLKDVLFKSEPAQVNDIIHNSVRENVDFSEILEICRNAKKILQSAGIVNNSNGKYDNLSSNRTASSIAATLGIDSKKIVKDAIASIGDSIYSTNAFKEEKSSKESKSYKGKRYSFADPKEKFISDLCNDITRNPSNHFSSAEEFFNFNSKLPVFAQNAFVSTDLEYFKVGFISNWLLSGGSFAQGMATIVADDLRVNSNLKSYWDDNASKHVDPFILETFVNQKKTLQTNFSYIYEASQQFFKEKLKKKYEGHKFKLYRGVGCEVVDTYIPGALESWSVELSTAKRFAKMMDSRNGIGTVFYAEVPVEDIFTSWEASADVWAGEEDLAGKKEYVVMGGTFATTEISVVDMSTKEKTKKLKPFREWIEMSEDTITKKKIKIVTPSDEDFAVVINKENTAKGNDELERKIKKEFRK